MLMSSDGHYLDAVPRRFYILAIRQACIETEDLTDAAANHEAKAQTYALVNEPSCLL